MLSRVALRTSDSSATCSGTPNGCAVDSMCTSRTKTASIQTVIPVIGRRLQRKRICRTKNQSFTFKVWAFPWYSQVFTSEDRVFL